MHQQKVYALNFITIRYYIIDDRVIIFLMMHMYSDDT